MKRMALVFLAVLVTFSAMAFAYKIGIVLDTGGRGDLSFNDAAYAGVELAVKDFGLDGIVFAESKSAADYLPNLRAQAKQADIELIVGVGFLLTDAVKTVATEYPNKKFAYIDAIVPMSNVLSIVFKENDGSAVIGALAAMLAVEQNKPAAGVVFGIEGSVLYHFEGGFRFGMDWGLRKAQAVKNLATTPRVKLLAPYTGSFSDIALGKTTMEAQLAAGVVGSYCVAGGLGIGMMQAIAQYHANAGTTSGAPYYFGVDQNQDWFEKGQFGLMSMLKRVDLGAYRAVESVVNGTFAGGTTVAYGVKEGGVYTSTAKDLVEAVEPRVAAGTIPAADKYAIYHNWAANRLTVPQWIWDAVDELNAKILSGELVTPFCQTKTEIEAVRVQYPLN